MILLLFGALAIGASLGLLGSGGSILTVPVLLMVLHRPEKLAIAESLAIVGGIALIGAISHALKAQIHWPSVVWFGLTGMVGAYLGAYGSSFVPSWCQITVFASVMLVAAAFMMFGRNVGSPPLEGSKSTGLMMRNGFFVGGLTGFVGIGGGFLIVPALVLFGNLPMHLAVGTSLAVIAMNAFTGFVEQLFVLKRQELHVSWQVIALVTPIGICGSLMGAALSTKISPQHLRRAFGLFIACLGIYLLMTCLYHS
jgi:uncharacterized membrane protein YfcA